MKPVHNNPNFTEDSRSVWVLLLGVCLITLYFNPRINDPINTPKLLVLIILGGWWLGHILDYYRKIHLVFKTKETLYLIIPLLFIISMFVAFLFTDNKYIGFFGETQRRNGFLSYFSFTILFIFTSIKISYFYIYRVLRSTIILGCVLSGYGLMQISGNDFVDWDNPNNAMILTVGNPNFSSAMLAMVVLIGLFTLPIGKISSIYKILSILSILTALILIIKSQSRQGLVVILFAVLFYVTLFASYKNKKLRFPIATVSIIIVATSILGMLQIGPLKSVLYKGSVSVRGYYWRAAWKMFQENPILGVGLDRYGAYFKEYREPEYALINGFNLTSSNAHNTFLQLLSTGGFIVGMSYIALLSLIFITGLKNIAQSQLDEQKINLLLLSAWIGFQAQSFISIDNIGISVWGWLLAGCILAIGRNSDVSIENNFRAKKLPRNRVTFRVFQSAVSALVVIPMIVIAIYLNRMESDTYIIRAYATPNDVQSQQVAIGAANKLLGNPLADPNYKFLASIYLADMGLTDQALSTLLILNRKDPRDLNVLLVLSEFEKNKGNFIEAIHYRVEISKLDPWNAENYLELGRLYVAVGDFKSAVEMKSKIMDFASNTSISQQAEKEL